MFSFPKTYFIYAIPSFTPYPNIPKNATRINNTIDKKINRCQKI